MKRFYYSFQAVFVLLAATALMAGCELLSESPDDTPNPPAGVYVANQGNFSDANGTITLYNPESKTVTQDALPNLGTIIQSITFIGDQGYVMSNSANRIDVFNAGNQTRTAQITDINSPRYMVPVGSSEAYVTNLMNGTVTVLNTETNTVKDSIAVGANPEGIAVANGKAFVANSGFGNGSTVSVIDLQDHAVTDTLDVACDGPRFAATDAENEVWVFCTGKTVYDENWQPVDQTNGAIRILDAESNTIIKQIPINGQIATAGPGQDAYLSNPANAAFVVVEKEKVLRFDTSTNTGPTEVALPSGDDIGAVAYSLTEDHLYVGRTPSFTEAGTVEIYSPGDTTVVSSFDAGIAPSYIAFKR